MNCVYAFFTKDTQECIYVGSTKHFWNRFGKHLVDSTGKKQQFKVYNLINQKGGWDNIDYRILEKDIEPQNLLIREKYYYLELKPSGNSQSPYQTQEERLEQIKEKNKKLRFNRVTCECGSSIPGHNIKRHMLTTKHQTWASQEH